MQFEKQHASQGDNLHPETVHPQGRTPNAGSNWSPQKINPFPINRLIKKHVKSYQRLCILKHTFPAASLEHGS
jgi:hypothetical protein